MSDDRRRTLQRHQAVQQPDPAPVRLAGLLVRAWFEVRAGDRPLRQLDAHLSPAARRRLRAALDRHEPLGTNGRPVVRRIVGCQPAPGVREVSVLIEHGDRLTAVAVRLERHRQRWRATELTAPEVGLTALPTASVDHARRPRDAFDEVFDEVGERLPEHLR